MFNTEIIKIPAYTLRDFLNLGVHKKNELYDYKFTPADRQLLCNGALDLFPMTMCDYIVNTAKTINGKEYKSGESIDMSGFDNETSMVLLKTGIVRSKLKDIYEKKDVLTLIRIASIDKYNGKTFQEAIDSLGFDKELVDETFKLKGDFSKKITSKKMEQLKELI